MLNNISPVPHEIERRLTIRKRCSVGCEILTSSPFRIKLEEKREAKIEKADQQRKRKETRGKNQGRREVTTPGKTTEVRCSSGFKGRRAEGIECTVCDDSLDEDWTGCNANFVASGHEKTAQARKDTLVFINVTFEKIRLTFNCLRT
jgi:hypothetical protein